MQFCITLILLSSKHNFILCCTQLGVQDFVTDNPAPPDITSEEEKKRLDKVPIDGVHRYAPIRPGTQNPLLNCHRRVNSSVLISKFFQHLILRYVFIFLIFPPTAFIYRINDYIYLNYRFYCTNHCGCNNCAVIHM